MFWSFFLKKWCLRYTKKTLTTSLLESLAFRRCWTRQPMTSEIFAPFHFCKEGFETEKKTFLIPQKDTPSSSYFLFFLALKFFWFRKPSINRAKKMFLKKTYNLTRISEHLSHLYPFFKKKTQFVNFLRNLIICVAFYDKFTTNWSEKLSYSEKWTNIVKANVKHWV